MNLLMRDSTDPFAIPADTPVVAGYGDGRFQWSSAGWARFPNAVKLSIVCFPQSIGDILDIETGCAAPADAPDWCDLFARPGRRAPSLYVNRSNWGTVRSAVGSRRVDYWVATLDGTQSIPGAVAVQYCGASDSNDPCRTSGHYDESVILDPAWVGGILDQPTFDALLRGNADFQALAWRVKALVDYVAAVEAGPTAGEVNQLRAKLDGLGTVTNLQPVLDAIAVLKADLDALTLKKA